MNNAFKISSLLLLEWCGRLFSRRALSIPRHLLVFPETDTLAPASDVWMTSVEYRPHTKNVGQPDTQELLALLRGLIRKAAIQGHSKPWLESALKATLRSYPHLLGTMQEVAILLFISRSVSRNCPYAFDTDELRTLWG